MKSEFSTLHLRSGIILVKYVTTLLRNVMETSRNEEDECDKENHRHDRERRSLRRKKGRSRGRSSERKRHDGRGRSRRRSRSSDDTRRRDSGRSRDDKRHRGHQGRRHEASGSNDPSLLDGQEGQTSLSSDTGMRLFLTELAKTISSNRAGGNKFPVLGNVIPEFDPMNKSQTIRNWLNKVEECVLSNV